MTYTLIANSACILRDADNANIPPDPNNADYRVYLAWVAAGNTPTPAPAPAPVVPSQVSRRQFFAQAVAQGLIQQSDAIALFTVGTIPTILTNAVAQLPAAQQFSAKLAILGDQIFYRNDALVVALGPLMGMTPAQLDAYFTAAAAL